MCGGLRRKVCSRVRGVCASHLNSCAWCVPSVQIPAEHNPQPNPTHPPTHHTHAQTHATQPGCRRHLTGTRLPTCANWHCNESSHVSLMPAGPCQSTHRIPRYAGAQSGPLRAQHVRPSPPPERHQVKQKVHHWTSVKVPTQHSWPYKHTLTLPSCHATAAVPAGKPYNSPLAVVLKCLAKRWWSCTNGEQKALPVSGLGLLHMPTRYGDRRYICHVA